MFKIEQINTLIKKSPTAFFYIDKQDGVERRRLIESFDKDDIRAIVERFFKIKGSVAIKVFNLNLVEYLLERKTIDVVYVEYMPLEYLENFKNRLKLIVKNPKFKIAVFEEIIENKPNISFFDEDFELIKIKNSKAIQTVKVNKERRLK